MARSETTVKVYSDPKAYQRDAAKMAQQGWRVVSVTERRPPSGCGRLIFLIFTLGIFAILFPHRPELVVTYERSR